MKTEFKIGDRVKQNNVPSSLPNPIMVIKGIKERHGVLCYFLGENMAYSDFNFCTPVDAGNLELAD